METKGKFNILESANEDSILDVINNAGIVTPEAVQQASEELAKKKQQQVSDKIKDVVQRSEYVVKSSLLAYRRSNDCNKKNKEYLKDLSALRNSIVEDAKVSIDDFDSKAAELKKKLDKDLRELNNQYDEAERKLNEYFPGSWSYRYSNLIPGKS